MHYLPHFIFRDPLRLIAHLWQKRKIYPIEMKLQKSCKIGRYIYLSIFSGQTIGNFTFDILPWLLTFDSTLLYVGSCGYTGLRDSRLEFLAQSKNLHFTTLEALLQNLHLWKLNYKIFPDMLTQRCITELTKLLGVILLRFALFCLLFFVFLVALCTVFSAYQSTG